MLSWARAWRCALCRTVLAAAWAGCPPRRYRSRQEHHETFSCDPCRPASPQAASGFSSGPVDIRRVGSSTGQPTVCPSAEISRAPKLRCGLRSVLHWHQNGTPHSRRVTPIFLWPTQISEEDAMADRKLNARSSLVRTRAATAQTLS
jgi:hypothetical protein